MQAKQQILHEIREMGNVSVTHGLDVYMDMHFILIFFDQYLQEKTI